MLPRLYPIGMRTVRTAATPSHVEPALGQLLERSQRAQARSSEIAVVTGD